MTRRREDTRTTYCFEGKTAEGWMIYSRRGKGGFPTKSFPVEVRVPPAFFIADRFDERALELRKRVAYTTCRFHKFDEHDVRIVELH